MTKPEIIKLTERVPQSVSEIERGVGMPASTLLKAINGQRELPKKWLLLLEVYCQKHAIPVITEVQPPEPVAVRIPAKKKALSPYLQSRQQSKLGKKP